MHPYNLTDKCKTESHAAKFPASGFVQTEKGFKYPFFKFFGDTVSSIFNCKMKLTVLLCGGYCDCSIGKVIFYGIFDKIIYKSIDENITSH